MHGNLPAQAQRAIFSVAISGNDELSLAKNGNEWFRRLCRNVWPLKAAAHIEHYTKAPARTCHRWAAGDSEVGGNALRNILRGDAGDKALAEIMCGSKATWWRRHRLALAALPAVEHLRQLELPLE